MNNLVLYFKNQNEFKRLKQLNKYFKKNTLLYDKINLVKKLQKDYLYYKRIDNLELANKINNEYKINLDQIIDLPFVEEYFDLLNLFYNSLNYVKNAFEESILLDL